MKIDKKLVLKVGASFVIFGAGLGTGYYIGKKKSSDEKNEEELLDNDCDDQEDDRFEKYRRGEIYKDEPKIASVEEEVDYLIARSFNEAPSEYPGAEKVPQTSDPGGFGNESDDGAKPNDISEEETLDLEEKEAYEEYSDLVDPTLPEIRPISAAEFEEGTDDASFWEQVFISYHDEDEVFVQHHEVIESNPDFMGDAVKHEFRMYPGREVIYIRNQKLRIDYEIDRIRGPYYIKGGDEY